MIGTGGPIRAVAVLELRRSLRSPGMAAGAIAFVTVLALGHWSYWSALPPRPADDRLFSWAYILGTMGALRFGIANDRALELDEFLAVNLINPARYVAGKVLAVVVLLGSAAAWAFAWALALSAGEWRYAVWYTTLFTLVAWMMLPALLTVELVTRTRYPAAAVFVLFVVALIAARAIASPEIIVGALGFDVRRFDYATLAPLAGRAMYATALLALLYPLIRLRLLGRAGWRWGGA